MTNLRKLAQGRECSLRLAGCSRDPEKTVLCHIRRGNVAGMGQKPSDLIAFPADAHCHDIIDRRIKSDYSREEIDMEILRAWIQWMDFLVKNEIVVVV